MSSEEVWEVETEEGAGRQKEEDLALSKALQAAPATSMYCTMVILPYSYEAPGWMRPGFCIFPLQFGRS